MCEGLDIELFIEEVKKLPVLWNTSDETYKDKKEKQKAWFSICEIFCEDFNQKSESERNELGNKFKSKWRNLRDNFIRMMKRNTKTGQADVYKRRQYLYGRNLSFLLQLKNAAAEESGDETKYSRNSYDIVETIINSDEDDSEWTPTSGRPNLAVKKQRSSPRLSSKRRKTDIDETPRIVKPSEPLSTAPELDADRAFFESLLPSVRYFNTDQKLALRSEFINVIRKMRNATSTE